MIDSYYTPIYLASRLVEYLKDKNFNNVVDFCIGDGELIRVALRRWPKIKCYGTDISNLALKQVIRNHPDWILSKCDFLSEYSRNRCKVFGLNKSGFDLILLNPPFSCIGGTVHNVTLNGISFKVSTAMKFLSESIKYLSLDGCILAIMPITSKKWSVKGSLINKSNLFI